MTKYEEYTAGKRRQYGAKFSPANLHAHLIEYFNTQVRVRVRFAHGEELTGRIGVTSGWVPAFLLMRRNSDRGSVHVLGAGDRVVAIFGGRRGYVPVPEVQA